MTDDEPPLREPMPAPEIYVEGFAGASVINGVAKFPFFTVVHDDNGGERRIVARLAIPLGPMVGIHDALGRLIAQLKAQGMLIEREPN